MKNKNPLLLARKYLIRGDLAYEEGDLKLAIHNYGKAIKINPKFWEAYTERARAKSNSELDLDATSDCNMALLLNPKNVDAYSIRADQKVKSENYEEALNDYNEILMLNPKDGDAYLKRANTRFKLGMKNLMGNIVRDPRDNSMSISKAEAGFQRGQLEECVKDMDAAISYLKDKVNIRLAKKMRKTAKSALKTHKRIGKIVIDKNRPKYLSANNELNNSVKQKKSIFMAFDFLKKYKNGIT